MNSCIIRLTCNCIPLVVGALSNVACTKVCSFCASSNAILRPLCGHLCKVCSAIHEMRRVGRTDRSETQWITPALGLRKTFWMQECILQIYHTPCLHATFGWRLIQKCHMAKLKLHPVPIPAGAILQVRRQWENLHQRSNGIMLRNLT